MRGMKETFIVMGIEARQVFLERMTGRAVKASGEVITFDTRAGAEAYRDSLRKGVTIPNVSYTVESLFE